MLLSRINIFKSNSRELPVPSNEFWLVGSGDNHVVIPPMAAYLFVETFFGPQHVLDIIRGCITKVKRLGTDVILNKNFLSWTLHNHCLTQCIFKKAKPLGGLEFDINATSNIYKIIDSDRAGMVIYVDVPCIELLQLAKLNFGISDPVLMANNLYDGLISIPQHNYVASGVIGELCHNPVRPAISTADHTAISRIIHDAVEKHHCKCKHHH